MHAQAQPLVPVCLPDRFEVFHVLCQPEAPVMNGRSARSTLIIADHSMFGSKRSGHACKVVWYSGTTVKEYYRIVSRLADHKHRQPGSWRSTKEISSALSIFPTKNCGRSSGRSRFIGGTMNTSNLEFWFEFGSAYSYLSAARIEDAAVASGVPILWEPFLLGPIFAEQGWDDSPFNVYPAKGRYMWRDVERLCARYRIPFAKPSRFPRNGLLASRVACLARATSERWLSEFVRAVFRANFAEDREIEYAAEVRSILDSLGQSGMDLIEQAQAPENKLRLREQTRRAKELGIFGAPSFVVGEELFWGNDRLQDALTWASYRTDEDVRSGR